MQKMSSTALLLGIGMLLVTVAGGCGSNPERSERTGGARPATTTPPATRQEDLTTSPARRSTGCGLAPDVAPMADRFDGDVAASTTSGGVERSYRLAVPPNYDPDVAVPLVLNLHGLTYTALKINKYTSFPQAATARGMIVISPDGLNEAWDVNPTGLDGEFLNALVMDVQSRYCINEDRVHAIGMSLGGWRAAASACAYPGTIASIVLVAIDMFPGTCAPMPVVAFHGTADKVIAYGAGGGTVDPAAAEFPLPGALDNLAHWATSGRCGTEPTVDEIGSDVILRRYPDCSDGVEVELYTILGGGHSWPRPVIDLAADTPTTDTISATDIALDFFEAHPRPETER